MTGQKSARPGQTADRVTGMRFHANLWSAALPPAQAARHAGRPARFILHPQQ